MSKKTETLEEFLARGGKVKQLDFAESAKIEERTVQKFGSLSGKRIFRGQKSFNAAENHSKWSEAKEAATRSAGRANHLRNPLDFDNE